MGKAILILLLGFCIIGKSAGVELNIHSRPLQSISSGCTLSIKSVNGYVMKEPDLESYSEGDTVRLLTRPAVGYKFSHWEGDASGNRLIADIIMTGNKTVTAVFETWTPPIGIPAPEFGIFETYRMYDDQAKRNPSLTYSPNAEGGYYTHYVDNTHPKSTDTNNNYGTAEKPRKTLPKADNIPAGSVIEFHGGPYTIGYLILRVTGTADMPIFIRGASPDERIVINTSNFYLNSQYVIMENFKMSLCVRSFIDQQAHHISVRNIDSKGLSALSWDGGCSEDIVFYSIYNNSESFDPADGPFDESDGGGIGINLGSNRIWTIDNIITRAGGDAVGGGHAANYTAKNYYVGRNIMHTCGENAIDVKEVDNIIISENVMYNFKGWSSGSDGTAVVFHYGPKYSPKNVWFMFNEIFDCSAKAIQVGGGQEYDIHIIGNLIHDIHNQENTADGYSSWSSRKVYLVNNTFHNIDNAVRSRIDATGGMLFAYNNIFSKVSEGGYHVFISGSNHMANSVIENNLFFQPGGKANIIWGSTPYSLEQFISNTTQGKGCVEGNPLFVNAQEVNFRLQPGSAAIDRADESTLYQQFQDTYKLDIRFDKDGTARPKGSAWDIGAYEYKYEGDDTEPPSQPTGLSANSVTHSNFILSWNASTDNAGVIVYEVFKNGISLGTTTSTSMAVTGLAASTTYAMTVRARDAARNWSVHSIALNVTTEAQTDFLAPAIPTGLVAGNISASGFTLSWTPSTDNVEVTGYDVYMNDTLIASVTVNSATITGLKPSAACSITVKARDAAGNISGLSAALEVKTLSGWTTTAKFQSFDVSTQTGKFTAEFDAIPNSANMDGVTAIINGTATKYSDLACSVLFDVSGKIKALNGSSYSSANDLFYTVGKKYHFRLVINIPEHTYSIFVTPQDGMEVTIGMNYAFRTSQAGATKLTGWAFIAETGAHTIDNVIFSNDVVEIIEICGIADCERIFPNPASGRVTIPLGEKGPEPFVVRIYSVTGQLVYERTNVHDNQIVVYLPGYDPGIYLVRVVSGKKMQVHQLILK